LNAPLYLIDDFGKMKLFNNNSDQITGFVKDSFFIKMSFKEKIRKIILQNFVEKLSFSLSLRTKQLKMVKSTIHFVVFNYYALKLTEKTEGSRKKLNSGNYILVKNISLALQ
jgi:beta-glucosidase/6-phospho-beta-glucosidase/beta-galactosidase